MSDSSNKSKKRPNGHGSVFQRKDGRWVAEFNDRDAFGYGRRRQIYARSEEEAWDKFKEAVPAERRGLKMLELDGALLFDAANPHVYLIQSTHGGPIKIGYAKDVAQRMAVIQLHCPFPLYILRIIENGGVDVERWLHRKLARHRLHGEWFADHPSVHKWAQVIDDLIRNTDS